MSAPSANAKGHTTSWIVYGTPPGDASSSLIGSVHAVRCCRLFGLLVRTCWDAAGLYGDTRNGSQIGYASLRAPIQELVFPIPSHLTVCPYLSSDLLASPTASRASPSQAMPGAR